MANPLRYFAGYCLRFAHSNFLPVSLVPRTPAYFGTTVAVDPVLTGANQTGLQLISVSSFGTAPKSMGIIVDKCRLWISGDTSQAVAGVNELYLVANYGLVSWRKVGLGSIYVPAAAPASPSALLYDSGWCEFGAGGFGAELIVGEGGSPEVTYYLIGNSDLTGTVQVDYFYHWE